MLLSGAAFKELVHSEAPSLVPSEALLLYSGEFHIPKFPEPPLPSSGAVAGDPMREAEDAETLAGPEPPPRLSESSASVTVTTRQRWWWNPLNGWRRGVDVCDATADATAGHEEGVAAVTAAASPSCSRSMSTPATATALSSLYQVRLLLPGPHCTCHATALSSLYQSGCYCRAQSVPATATALPTLTAATAFCCIPPLCPCPPSPNRRQTTLPPLLTAGRPPSLQY